MSRSNAPPTPLGAVTRGLAAGVVGTAVMTLVQELSAKLQAPSDGAAPPPQDPWAQASAPAKVGRRIIEGVFEHPVPPERIGLLTNVMHWAYGTGWGAIYGIVEGTFPGHSVRRGLLFGSGVWVMGYVQLVPMGIYELPWRYPAQDVALELGYHLAYGVGVDTGHRLLTL